MTLISGPNIVDPLGDAEKLKTKGFKKNFAKVGSGRPSSLLYTYGPGAIMDLPHFTVMPMGLDAWDRIWAKRDGTPHIHAPKLLDAVRKQLGPQVSELRPFPHQPETTSFGQDGKDLGVPAIVFPQWLRCTGCDLLAPLSTFQYSNTHPYRPDEAKFEHVGCPGRGKGNKGGGNKRNLALPARYLLACTNGHLDEFPYSEWVHHGKQCPQADIPRLKMLESTISRGASATIACASCGARRGMSEAQGSAGQEKLPACRGRHPHLDAYAKGGCEAGTHLMLVGASNLWFPILETVIVMPMDPGEKKQDLADRLKAALGSKLAKYADDLETLRDVADGKVNLSSVSDSVLQAAVNEALNPTSFVAAEPAGQSWSPDDLLVPEWNHLILGVSGEHHSDPVSGLTVSKRQLDPKLPKAINRVLAVEKLRSATALLGFTRIDDLDRIDDQPERRAPLPLGAPTWIAATENRGEGIFLQLDESKVASWEAKVESSELWEAHVAAHMRNFYNRMSTTATMINPEGRMRPPRYWLLHTFAHVLFREMAMSSGYGAASISERIYAWQGSDSRDPAAGLLLLTTSSDSDGTLGGLVQLSEPASFRRLIDAALHRATRCSSDPVCSHRTPHAPEDFLHGAACHCCTMASETSCERSNRFLDRRFLVGLPGRDSDLGFFQASR